MGQDAREQVVELRAVAPLVAVGGDRPTLVCPCTLIHSGGKTIAVSSAERLRAAGNALGVALRLDGSQVVPVAAWMTGRDPRLAIIELGGAVSADSWLDVGPLAIGAVSATVDTRGAPAALVTFAARDGAFARRIVPVHIDAVDAGGMSDDVVARLATPTDAGDADAAIDGAAAFAWLPPDPVLGRPSEVVAVAIAVPYPARTHQPRERPAIAEVLGLADLARALPFDAQAEGSNELAQVAGEIRADSGPVRALDLKE